MSISSSAPIVAIASHSYGNYRIIMAGLPGSPVSNIAHPNHASKPVIPGQTQRPWKTRSRCPRAAELRVDNIPTLLLNAATSKRHDRLFVQN